MKRRRRRIKEGKENRRSREGKEDGYETERKVKGRMESCKETRKEAQNVCDEGEEEASGQR